jgi:hypothetical protein
MDDLLIRLPRRTFRVSIGLAETAAAVSALNEMNGVECAPEGSDLVISVSSGTTIGEVVSVLTASGLPVTAVNEEGSTVEAAYRHVLGVEPRGVALGGSAP